MSKFEKLIHGIELYVVLALIFVGFCLGVIVNLEIKLNDINLQTWSTVGLLVIGIFTWLTSVKSGKTAMKAQQQAMFPFQNEVFQGIQKLVNVANRKGASSITKKDVEDLIYYVNLSRWCFTENPEIYNKCNDFFEACQNIESYREIQGGEFQRLKGIINDGCLHLMNNIYSEFNKN